MAAQLRFLNPKSISKPPGYTHVVEATGPGRIVYIAGQLGLDVGGKVVGQAGDFRAQAIQTFENLKAALAEVGATFNDVVKINNYLTDLPAHLPIFREVRDMYLDKSKPPASTTIQISALAREGALLETEAIAILPAVAERKAAASRKGGAKKAPAKKRAAAKKPAKKQPAKKKRR
jgi:enamine deaminase RidA (YjgF/YER057c/UK114 family)